MEVGTGVKIRKKVIFQGDVQGVGFRDAVKRIAENFFSISGSARNLPNGSVEVILEGDEFEVSHLISSIEERFSTPNKEHIASYQKKPFVSETLVKEEIFDETLPLSGFQIF